MMKPITPTMIRGSLRLFMVLWFEIRVVDNVAFKVNELDEELAIAFGLCGGAGDP